MTLQEKRDYMEGLVRKWRSSPLTKVAFCKEHNLPKGTFSYWLWKDNKQKAAFQEVVPPKKKPTAKPVVPKRAKAVASQQLIEISLPNGVHIKLPANTPPSTLQALIAV